MENYVAAQLQQLGAAVALGAAGGLVYDVLRAARLLDRRDRLLTHLLDALFVALLGAGVLWLALVVGEGELRLYMVTGMALGAVLWFYLFSRLLRPVWDFWAAALVAVLGIQLVKVYGQLKTAQREESVLNQQLTQQQQENDALRSDLSKKDDESFIKALARELLGLAEEGERIFYDVNH